MIPMQTAAGSRLLLGLIPEQLTLTVGKESYSADYLIAPTVLGCVANGFDAIIPSD